MTFTKRTSEKERDLPPSPPANAVSAVLAAGTRMFPALPPTSGVKLVWSHCGARGEPRRLCFVQILGLDSIRPLLYRAERLPSRELLL